MFSYSFSLLEALIPHNSAEESTPLPTEVLKDSEAHAALEKNHFSKRNSIQPQLIRRSRLHRKSSVNNMNHTDLKL